jgi:hypothetical protein
MKIRPRTAPRDVIDILIGMPIGLLQVGLTLGIPAIIVAFSFNLMSGALTYLALYGASFLFMVTSLDVQEDAILFRRPLRKPKHLAKSDIMSIVEVPRSEVVLRGWLWPPWPFAREMTACLSARQHFRIQWKCGFCYFPPKDVDHFRQVMDVIMRGNPTTKSTLSSEGVPSDER